MSDKIEIIKAYADENVRMAQNIIINDPILNNKNRGKMSIQQARKLSERLRVQGCVYSSKWHAANEILALIGVENERYDVVNMPDCIKNI